MKKGEIREGIVEQVKFPNKGCVRLLPVVKEPPEESLRTAAEENVIPALGASSEAEEDKAEYATVKKRDSRTKAFRKNHKGAEGKGRGACAEAACAFT